MSLELQNTVPALSASHDVLGAAIKILIAGGSEIGEKGMRQASAASPHMWTRKRKEIVELVKALEA